MNKRNLVSAIDKLLDAKQDVADLLSENNTLATKTEDLLSDAIDYLIADLYHSSREEFSNSLEANSDNRRT